MRRLNEQVSAQQAEIAEQKTRIEKMEKDLARLTGGGTGPKPNGAGGAVAPAADGSADATAKVDTSLGGGAPAVFKAPTSDAENAEDPRQRVVIYGYLQGEYQSSQASEDQVRQGGAPLNLNRFVMRRVRLVAEREWKYAAALLELDGNTVNGPQVVLQRAEATLLYRGDNPISMPPLVSLTLGQFRVPFGAENLESPRTRYFMERSLAMQAMFPTEIDLGVRLAGALGWMRYSVAAINGQPLGSRDYPLQDPNAAKDVTGRLGAFFKPVPALEVAVGMSALAGKGFHKESDATKGAIQWNDTNGDGVFQTSEVSAIAPVATRASTSYDRFAIGVDALVRLKWSLGWGEIGGAFYAANNMDRGLYFSDPVLLGRDTRHFGHMVSIFQEIGPWVGVGFRQDSFNPDSDKSDFQGAKRVQPFDTSVHTFSPLVALLYEKRARLLFQYDFVRDKLGRDQAGVSTDFKNDRWTLRLQVAL